MKDIRPDITYHLYQMDELCSADQTLVNQAIAATDTSYAPYSHFSVGAALRLANGKILTGSNQENAAYPSGLCAERTVLFYAGAHHPNIAADTIAIAARNEKGNFAFAPPCGACRQVMIETQQRGNQPLRTLLFSIDGILEISRVEHLLPLSFDAQNMK